MNACVARPLQDLACCQNLAAKHGSVALVEAVEFLPGHILDGRFVIGEPISQGGMATIYHAEDVQNGGRKVAIKMPFARFERDPAYVARFLREEQIGLKLDHPALLKFIPVEGKKSRLYLVTEYLEGRTLARILHQHRPLPEVDAFKIMGLVCDAVRRFHAHGFVHRDLKPDNIMLCADHTIRIMDFGLASPVAGKLDFLADMTPVFGTPQYMAPEQVKRSRCDIRADIYSIGVILYEMLTGKLPFNHEDPWVMAQSRVAGDPVAPRTINPTISPQAEEIVLRALRRKPVERYPTLAALAVDLAAPDKVVVTGLCNCLKPPRFVLSFEQAQMVRGVIITVAFVILLVGAFFVLMHLPGKHH
ncbi:MAG TPA: serine/threonine-protein kinase [Opitutales bacterium]|jgi:serine/threonine protein kinase|nr:serine/threonine-protein kinase [Opitutales bacterium]